MKRLPFAALLLVSACSSAPRVQAPSKSRYVTTVSANNPPPTSTGLWKPAEMIAKGPDDPGVLFATAAVRVEPAPASESPNFELVSLDVVDSPESDALSLVRVFSGERLLGQTDTAPLSRPRRWESRLPEGNLPLRFERWILPGTGAWLRADDDFQPRERFYRVADGRKTRVQLKFFESGRRYALEVLKDDGAEKP
ncbi:MAG TPA: hypothetical protein DCM05_00835 [Elusimicrobia bacterium]|nr:hypothetical protein [Elusimicrobiota bacterium]